MSSDYDQIGESGSTKCCRQRWCTPCWATVTAVFGVGLVLVAILVPPYIRTVVNDKLCDQLCIPDERSPSDSDYWRYSNWLTNDNQTVNPPEYNKYYFFNMTNAGAVVNNGAKPNLTLVGPYTYQIHKFKYDVSWSATVAGGAPNDLVNYEQGQYYTFVPAMSNGKEDDQIMTINLPFIAGVYTLQEASGLPLQSQFMSLCPFENIEPKYTHSECLIDMWTIRQHLFNRLSFAVGQGNAILFNPLAQPHWPPNFIDENFQVFPNCTTPEMCHDLFANKHYYGLGGGCFNKRLGGFFGKTSPIFCLDAESMSLPNYTTAAGYNGTVYPMKPIDLHTIEHTGQNGNFQDLGLLEAWMGNKTTERMINGTEHVRSRNQLQFQTDLSAEGDTSPLRVWDPQIMRAFEFNFDSKQSILGIDVLRYRPQESTFAGTDPRYFGPGIPGLINASSSAFAQFGVPAPIFGSRPFYANADLASQAQLLDQFTCSNCPTDVSVATWDTYFDVEPTTGKVLRGSKKVQFSAQIGQPNLFQTGLNLDPAYQHVRTNMILPLFYYEYTAQADDSQADMVKDGLNQLHMAKVAEVVLLIGGLVVGAVSIIVSIGLFYRYCSARSEDGSVQTGSFQPMRN